MKNKPELIAIGKGYSLFSFLDKYCLGEASGLSHNAAFHRLCSLMRKMNVKTTVVEERPTSCDEIKDESLALNTYYGKPIKIMAYRITFLTEEISKLEEVKGLKNENILSAAIIINFKDPDKGWNSYLYSAIITIPKIKNVANHGDIPLLNNYLHIFRTFKGEVDISDNEKFKYNITGTFFCQQNSITSVCAHASLCMVLNNMELSDSIITPEHINKIIGVDHQKKKFGHKPNVYFTNEEIIKVLSKYKLTYELLNFFDNPNIEYNDQLYKYIESKCPVLLIFRTKVTESHVVPVLGHTLNSDMWRPEAEKGYSPSSPSRLEYFISSSAWVDHFIINDDNFGMYYCLPIEALKRITLPKYDPTFRAEYAVILKPPNVSTPPREAEGAASIITIDMLDRHQNVGNIDIWSERLVKRVLHNRLFVIRTLLVKKDDYIKSLEENDFENNPFTDTDIKELTNNLPELFWLSEITLPELYTANKHKIIDFFYGCDHPQLADKNEIYKRWIQIRFPFILIKRNDSGLLSSFPMSVKSHYPLYRHEKAQNFLEW